MLDQPLPTCWIFDLDPGATNHILFSRNYHLLKHLTISLLIMGPNLKPMVLVKPLLSHPCLLLRSLLVGHP